MIEARGDRGEPCATWARVSTGDQDEENQTAELDAHVASHGYDIQRKFVLHDVSASAGDQEPELAEVIADLRAGKYSVLVIVHSSRIDRREDLDAQARFVMDVRAAGGRIESVREPTFGGKDLAGQITTIVAQYSNAEYSRTIKGHIAAGMRKIMAAGAFSGSEPWGYVSVGPDRDKRLVPTRAARVYVPQIMAKVAAGQSLGAVARWLTAEGVEPGRGEGKSRRKLTGRAWHAKAVAELVRRNTYAGTHRCSFTVTWTDGEVQRKETLRWTHQTENVANWAEVFAARLALDARGAKWKAQKGGGSLGGRPAGEPLSGQSRCRACGVRGEDSPMYRLTSGNLRCTGRGADRHGCGAPMVPLAVARRMADEYFGALTTWKLTRKVVTPGNRSEIEASRDELRLDRVAALDLPKADRRLRMAELDAREDELDALEVTPDVAEVIETGETFADVWNSADDAERGRFLRRWDGRVEFGPADGTETRERDGHGLWINGGGSLAAFVDQEETDE